MYTFNQTTIDKIIDAIYYRHDVYCNQKYDEHLNYSYHLKAVVNIANKYLNNITNIDKYDSEFNIKQIIVVAAAAHDIIEDARMTYNDVVKFITKYLCEDENIDKEICNKFATNVADIVYAVTDEKGKNRSERHNYYYWKLLLQTKYASFIKICDRFANFKYSINTNNNKMVNVYITELRQFIYYVQTSIDFSSGLIEESKILSDLIKYSSDRF